MKQFVMASANLNSYGFHLDMEKLDLARFKTNPVLLYNHKEMVGRWSKLELKDGKLLGTPEFMDGDKEELAAKISKRVEDGFVRGASVGIKIKSINREGDKPVVAAEVVECSVVDVPSDASAITLYDENRVKLEGNALELAFSNIKKINPKPNEEEDMTKLSKDSLVTLGLSSDADASAIDAAIELQHQENKELKAKIEAIESEKIEALLSAAIESGQIKATEKSQFQELAAANFDLAKNTIDKIPARAEKLSAQSVTGSNVNLTGREEWTAKDWRQKDRKGYLELKMNDRAEFDRINNL